MQLNPAYWYPSLEFYLNDILQWSMKRTSADTLAEIVQPLNCCIPDMDEHEHVADALLMIYRVLDEPIQLNIRDSRMVENVLYHYVVPKHYLYDNLTGYQPDDEKYGWWIRDYNGRFSYKLCQFGSAGFVQGFISLCNGFEVDFRKYISGGPFRLVNKDQVLVNHLTLPAYNNQNRSLVLYDIEGYHVEPLRLVRGLPE